MLLQATIRAQLLEQEEDEQEAQQQEPSPPTVEEPPAALEAMAIEAPVKEVERQKASGRRSRKQTSPLQISQRIRASERDSNETITSPVPASTPPTSRPTSAVLVRPDPSTGEQSMENQQKRKRESPPSRIPSQESRPSLQETIENDSECEGRDIGASARAITANDRNKRPLLQQSFAPSSGAESISDDTSITGHEEDANSEPLHPEVREATEEEIDAIVCRLQLETNQDLPAVVHALYYFSGDVEKAKQFLKGASPSDIWCPEDDLLLGNLMTEGKLSGVDEALASGAFASLQKPHDSAAILKRVKFLQ
ncbi:hypothetical protein DVH05_007582 [Phytophthora capsici]|nr:hypothetical protein DVH05_007582 [Phytophthora capsici]